MADHDAIVVGAGHNGLVAATLLARAGYRVLALERSPAVGGAAVSASPFPGVDARISRYSYLVSLFPAALLAELGLNVEMRRRRVSSYTPVGDAGVLVCDDDERTRASLVRTLGDDSATGELERFGELTTAIAERVFPTLTRPLRPRDELGDHELLCRPLSELLTTSFASDVVRGIVATDGLIGTFASLDDPGLVQNRCLLYHVIGNGTGRWDVPVGGMGALTDALLQAALAAGVEVLTEAPVIGIEADGRRARVVTAEAAVYRSRHVLCGAAPAILAGLLGTDAPAPPPEGSQLKLNLLLRRLPRLRDRKVAPEDAFAGTLHVNESYEQLQTAYAQAAAGQIPALAPCEAYCHSLTDPSILGPELRAAGAQTLTVFGLHMPARLFRADAGAKRQAVGATLRSLNSVLGEPIEDCLMTTAHGEPCLEARTPVELEDELAMPGGHIFHRDLTWPFAETEDEIGRWGVETELANVWLCGAGARRGGGVSGIPGHNAAHAVMQADDGR
ncbi:MAG TPA: NAD(P)/FAD-dependent oxidoreductase [Solirubrobacteraceae bacterium]|nr:NAD(P)/FAD-dependent oxidoreductase [Solirubrobacteraceae bacterium]